ncbi:MAG: 3'(2'),5'-bisphosphate nucleotidase CysQ, partial [Nitrospirae bacterium CG_4_10_14_3_um_filter_53_41]
MDIHINSVCDIAVQAGDSILNIYAKTFDVEFKEDQSPLTEADRVSHRIISEELLRLYPDIPVLSEEGKDIPFVERKTWDRFWLVDPLDGTKEFIKRNGEFTVNIALIENNRPAAGVIYVPVQHLLYYASRKEGAWKKNGGDESVRIHVRNPDGDGLVVVQSRSHPSEEL